MDANNPQPAVPTTNEKADVVVVEDDPFISRMYQVKLAKAGYHIAMGVNGHDAVSLITQHQPRLALVDINMPEMTGIEAVNQLKNDGYDFSRTKIVFLTNSNNPNDIEKAKSMGADYLIKADQTPRGVLELIRKKIGEVSS
jgi:CheY-like chemotaxis protein